MSASETCWLSDQFVGAHPLSLGYPTSSQTVSLHYTNVKSTFDVNKFIARVKEYFKYDAFGHWLFFAADDAPALIEQHVCPQAR